MVVAENGLHEDAAEHRDGEQGQADKTKRGQLREPIGGFTEGKRIVDAVEVRVALAPDEFRRVESNNNVREERGVALDSAQHEVGYGPNVRVAGATRVRTV